jgi:creatinine amidohydrolase
MAASGWWQDLTAPDIAALDPAATVALLPVAAVEQHGPHLPLATDAVINAGIVGRALALLAARPEPTARLLVLPALDVGHSPEHAAVPGTLSTSAETLLALWTDVAAGVAAAGVRRLVLFNSHGGQTALVDLAAVRWRARFGMQVVRAFWPAFGAPPGLFDADEWRSGLHGGEVETALMLHLAPALVRMDLARDFRPAAPGTDGGRLGFEGPVGTGWLCTDLHPAGVCGNAAAADAERGKRLLEHLAQVLIEVVDELAALALPPMPEPGGRAE